MSKYSDGNEYISLIKKVHMGIPGGDNWLVDWKSDRSGESRYGVLCVYVINDNNIIEEINIGPNYITRFYTVFDIMQNIPGTRIGEGSCAVYDYNSDGFDKIFSFAFSGRGFFVIITGYDREERKIVRYADIPFEIINRETGPAPAEFIIYKGMKGFKVYYSENEVAGGPGWVSDPNPRNDKWIFFTWDERRREFIEVEEFEEGWEETYRESSQSVLAEQNTDELVERNAQEEVVSASGKSTRFNLYIVIIAAILALGAVMVFIVVKRKK